MARGAGGRTASEKHTRAPLGPRARGATAQAVAHPPGRRGCRQPAPGRLLAKRLRYNIEALRPLLPQRAGRWHERARQQQTEAGELRDTVQAAVLAAGLGAPPEVVAFCGAWPWGWHVPVPRTMAYKPGRADRCRRHDLLFAHCPARMSSTLPSRLSLYLDLIRWSRPAGWLAAAAIGPRSVRCGWRRGLSGWHLVVVFTLGTILMRSAGCCVNDVADRDFDRHVKRTAQRPSPAAPCRYARPWAWGCAGAGGFCAGADHQWAHGGLVAAALGVTILYPFTKRFFSMPQAVLGVAFSMGIPMAFTAVQGQVPWLALWLVLGNLLWVLAYDTEYAMAGTATMT